MFKYRFITLLFLVFSGNMLNAQDTKSIIFHPSHEPLKATAPYSDVVEYGNMYFLAGQIGMDHSTRTLVKGGIKAEAKRAILNIREVLEQHDLTLDHVVKCLVVLRSMDDFQAFNEVYTQYFTKKPARTTFAASGIAGNGSVEIEVMAIRPE